LFDKIKDFFKDLADSVKKETGAISVLGTDFEFDTGIGDIYAPLTDAIALEGFHAYGTELKITDLEEYSDALCVVKGFNEETVGRFDRIVKTAVFTEEASVSSIEPPGKEVALRDFTPAGTDTRVYDESPEDTSLSMEQILSFPLYVVRGISVYSEEPLEAPGLRSEGLFASIKTNASDRIIARFPMKRSSVSRENYSTSNIKNALSFILDRIDHKPRSKWVGIFRDVPINRIKQLTFHESTLSFTLYSFDRRSIYILDVLAVFDEVTEKYHIAPIVRG